MRRRIGELEYRSIGRESIPSAAFHYSSTPVLHPRRRRGFTLLEILISMVILSIALTVAWQTFSTATRAWTGGRDLMDKIHHGDFVLTQMAASLRSMAFFDSAPEQYAFRMENNPAGYGEHTISWVTANGAFIPPGEVFKHGLHRIEIGGGRDKDGTEGLVVTVWPHLADEDEVTKKSWFVSENIKGLRCRVYDTKKDNEGWKDVWEYTNAIPGLIEITLYAEPVKEYGDPVEFRQLIEIPLGPEVTNDVSEVR